MVHTFPFRPMLIMIFKDGGGTWLFSARDAGYISGRTAVNSYVSTPIMWGDRSVSMVIQTTHRSTVQIVLLKSIFLRLFCMCR